MLKEDLEAILRQDPHVVEIHPAEEWDMPKIDYPLFKVEEREFIGEVIDRLGIFLNGPYIVDDFGNHSERREWAKQLESKYDGFYDYYRSNALKLNSTVQVIQSVMNHLEQYYTGRNSEKFQRATEDVRKAAWIHSSDYDLKSVQEKIEFVKQVKGKVYEVLKSLSVQGNQPLSQ